jgi:hypothetical protein
LKGLVFSVGLLAFVVVYFHPHPTRLLHGAGERLDPFRTPQVFAIQADAICADYSRAVSDLEPANGRWPAAQKAATRLLAISQSEVAKLHALELPTKNRGLAKKWIAGHDRIVVLLGQLRDAAQRKDKPVFMLVAIDLAVEVQREDRIALRLGMNGDCSKLSQ